MSSPKDDNGPIIISKNANGDVVKIVKIVNGIAYTKTIQQTDNVIASTQTISATIPSQIV